jgi:hypothetical protein
LVQQKARFLAIMDSLGTKLRTKTTRRVFKMGRIVMRKTLQRIKGRRVVLRIRKTALME